jgi:hypothetical protein
MSKRRSKSSQARARTRVAHDAIAKQVTQALIAAKDSGVDTKGIHIHIHFNDVAAKVTTEAPKSRLRRLLGVPGKVMKSAAGPFIAVALISGAGVVFTNEQAKAGSDPYAPPSASETADAISDKVFSKVIEGRFGPIAGAGRITAPCSAALPIRSRKRPARCRVRPRSRDFPPFPGHWPIAAKSEKIVIA